jgi:hypothetical protein
MAVDLTIAHWLELRAIFQLGNITFEALKVFGNSGCICSQPAIKYDQPSKNTKEQHGLFNA